MKELEKIISSTSNISDTKAAVISIFHINNYIKETILTHLKPHDLSIEQFNVMRILRGQKGNPLNLQDIQERMINKMSNTTRLVDKLLKKRFVKRTICKQNRRKVEISITELGLKTLNDLDAVIDNTEQNITAPLNNEELKQLNKLLLKLNN
ncbi:MAG: MarR family transcriptional regulator [Winogradskyella sp.]|uniref:MarR family winged helix-turn-helix transcriptional regulator n=1 Tax=Winogradskyella sp. TaxID=1883156 RepID=UPI000F417413|nr:MarR family transcriptional regulator [Winogradskyella sp.]RNC85023.1 MAG: MarR family transcriptional regulator [Winogradskyella sp.]